MYFICKIPCENYLLYISGLQIISKHAWLNLLLRTKPNSRQTWSALVRFTSTTASELERLKEPFTVSLCLGLSSVVGMARCFGCLNSIATSGLPSPSMSEGRQALNLCLVWKKYDDDEPQRSWIVDRWASQPRPDKVGSYAGSFWWSNGWGLCTWGREEVAQEGKVALQALQAVITRQRCEVTIHSIGSNSMCITQHVQPTPQWATMMRIMREAGLVEVARG